MSDLARWIVAVEMLTLLICLGGVVALHDSAARRAPRAWRWGAGGVVVVLVGVTIAVVLNALIAGEQTPGVKLLAYIAGPAATLGVVAVVTALRRQPKTEMDYRVQAVIENAVPLAEALSHLQHAEPCATPFCADFRLQLRALGGEPVER